MIGWIVTAIWPIVGFFVARRTFWNFEQSCFDQWPNLYRDRTTIGPDDVPIAVLLCAASFFLWPIVLLYWGSKGFVVTVFRSPRACAAEKKKRDSETLETAYKAFADTYREAGDNPTMLGLAQAQLIYAQSLGDAPFKYSADVARAEHAFSRRSA